MGLTLYFASLCFSEIAVLSRSLYVYGETLAGKEQSNAAQKREHAEDHGHL